jgi:predicted nucleic acid-binding protein
MDRLFLDANVLFSAAYRPGAGLLRLWNLPKVILCSSRYALEEARANLSTDSQRSRLATLSAALELFESESGELPAGVSLPDKDAPILLAAIAARATHLITGISAISVPTSAKSWLAFFSPPTTSVIPPLANSGDSSQYRIGRAPFTPRKPPFNHYFRRFPVNHLTSSPISW